VNIFGVGPMELLVVLFLAFLVLGPARMGSMARKVGGLFRDARKMTEGLPRTLDDLARQVEGPAQALPEPRVKPAAADQPGPTEWRGGVAATPPSSTKPQGDA